MIMSTIIMAGAKIDYQMSKSQIEDKARGMGMVYPEEVKVINDKDVSK